MSIAGLHRVGPTFLIADVDENESESKEKCSPISDHDRSALRAHFAHPTSPADRSRAGEVGRVLRSEGRCIITGLGRAVVSLFPQLRWSN